MILQQDAEKYNITTRHFVVIGKIWYYNNTLYCNRKNIILQQDVLLQYEKYYMRIWEESVIFPLDSCGLVDVV